MSLDPVDMDRRVDTVLMRIFAESPLHGETTKRVLRQAAEEIDDLRAKVDAMERELDCIPSEVIGLLREGGAT